MQITVFAPLAGAADPTAASPVTVRLLALALAAAVSVIVALVTVALTKLTGAHLATAVLRGGAAFGGALALSIAVLSALGIL